MIENLNSKIENSQIKKDTVDEIDLRLILNILLRNKSIVGFISIVTFFGGILYSYTLKEVWEGQFQIVLTSKATDSNLNSKLSELIGIAPKQANELKTEVGILKSPSVLMPVFEFAKSQNNSSLTDGLSFSSWKNQLRLELEPETSILNISYKSPNKKSIIPVLNKMSISYQQYSGKNKKRRQELTSIFFKEQISIFKNKSSNSLRAAQEYALDKDLIFYDLNEGGQNNIVNSENFTSNTTNFLSTNIGIETVRVQAANQIRKINVQLRKIRELKDPKELLYISSTFPTLIEEGYPETLSKIEAKLLEARSVYTDKDIAIVNLIKQRKIALDLLKDRTIKYLEVLKLDAEATMKAAMRPKDVLLKYKELIREAARDEQTLIQLEDQFNLFKLDLANQEDPWELITKPTLLDGRASPNRKQIALLSLIIGSIFGAAVSILKEKKSGKIFDSSEIEKLIPIKLVSKIKLSEIDYDSQNLLFIKDLLIKESSPTVNFVPIGKIEPQELEQFKESLINTKFAKDFEFSAYKDDLKKYSNYLILKLGYINYSDVFILKKRLFLLENNFNGLIILS